MSKQSELIKCADCHRELVVVESVGGEGLTKYKSKCTCGGSSFFTAVKGKHFIKSVAGLKIENVEHVTDNKFLIRVGIC